ncbi:aminoglycoside phosphotransferase family protein [Glutamicibacter arilaitensis]|uniref:aminoglycoside phosphotransferase family protein n=1 Tax=Glutamicibacter arilaitensis TaxID=256701 RepID=UPI00384ADEB5
MQMPVASSDLATIVDAVVSDLPARVRAARRTVVEEGSAHVVILFEGLAAVRITRDKFTGDQLRRRQELVDCIPRDIGLALPWSLGPTVEIDGLSAVATEFIPGSPCPVGDGKPEELQRLLELVASVDTAPLRGLLSDPLSFCGGADWYRIQIEEVIPRLDPQMRAVARGAVEALAGLSKEDRVFSHGDLGGHNVLWDQGRVAGILDWDLSSESDRSTDLASLGVWHGWEKLSKIASAEQVERASIRRNTFRLQQVGFLVVSRRPEPEILAAAGTASRWLYEYLA